MKWCKMHVCMCMKTVVEPGNLLLLSVQGPSEPCGVNMTYEGEVIYSVSFHPREKGVHVITIKWGKRYISGSPFVVTVVWEFINSRISTACIGTGSAVVCCEMFALLYGITASLSLNEQTLTLWKGHDCVGQCLLRWTMETISYQMYVIRWCLLHDL